MNSIPRPASTVVLMDHLSKVYMTKRPDTMKFMGGYYVFPGGSVDSTDDIQANNKFITGKRNDSFTIGHYVAAARELFEEVGVLVCKKKDGTPVHLDEKVEMEYRRLLINREISFLQLLQKEELQFPLESLAYIGQIVTPDISRIRFDTRFFLSYLPKGQTPKPDPNEISEACWMDPADALNAYKQGDISLAPPTIHTLKTIINYQKGGQLNMPEFIFADYIKDLRE